MWLFRYLVLGDIQNPLCKDHITAILQGLFKGRMWAINMIDSMGKIPAGVLTGNIIRLGNIQECLDAVADEEFGSFTGKYCVVEFPIPLPPNIKPDPEASFAYKWGVCLPSSCSAADLGDFLQQTLYLPAATRDSLCQTRNDYNPFKATEWFTIVTMIILLLLVLLSTLYDYWKSSEKKRILLSFSLRRNLISLLDTKTSSDSINILYGFRYIGIFFVILGNIYTAKGAWGGDVNRLHFLDWMSDWNHVYITSRAVMVDSFFVFSGMLISYRFMCERETGKKFSLAYYYIHRYLRIAPAAAVILLIEATLSNRFGWGPIWKDFSKDLQDYCSTNWWKYLLFINNWWGDEKCMEQTWFLAADMQLYFIAPLLLIPLHNWPRVGLGVTLFLTVAAFFSSFGLSLGLNEKVDLIRNSGDITEKQLFEGTYNRFAPWLTGFILGYFLYKFRNFKAQSTGQDGVEKKTNWHNVLLAMIGWIVVITMSAGILLAVHPFIQPDYEYNAFESAMYLAISHIVWSLCTVFAVAACVAGYGGFINSIFSWKGFVPLNRLIYGIYLIHFLIIKVRAIDIKTEGYLSDFNIFMMAIGILTATTILMSPILYFAVEAPFMTIEKILMYRGSKFEGNLECQSRNSEETIFPPTPSSSGAIYNSNTLELSVINLKKPQ